MEKGNDEERGPEMLREEKMPLEPTTADGAVKDGDDAPAKGGLLGYIQAFERTLVAYNLEARGIKRVEVDERQPLSKLGFTQVFVFWFSINLAANNITLGMLGPAVFSLGFLDSSICAVLGMLVGCLPTAYTAIFAPRSGNRTMIFARYTMGYWPSKIVVIFNIIVLVGYSLIDCVIAGQILSAVSPNNSMSIAVGIVIVAVIAWAVTTFGYSVFHYYERWAWLPQLIIYSILAGVAGPKFSTSSPSAVQGKTLIGNRLSFFSLCLSSAITYAGAAGDYFVYYPPSTPRVKIFSLTVISLATSFTFTYILGIGLASSLSTEPSWQSAYSTSQGALIVEAYRPLGAFGSFCGVLVALGLISNLAPPTYSAGVDFQTLGRHFLRIPRVFWNTLAVVIYTVCALAGRAHLAEIFTNFLALMGYFVCIWVAITLEEHLLFRRRGSLRGQGDGGFVWEHWNQRDKLPVGIAAFLAFCVGWVGAVLCMAQVWYVGPIARTVGDYGADMGNYVGFAWAAVVFPPLRWWELKRFGR